MLAWALLSICYFVMPGPRPDPGMTPVNINYVFGMKRHGAARTSCRRWCGSLALMIGLPLLAFIPTHFMLRRAVPRTGL